MAKSIEVQFEDADFAQFQSIAKDEGLTPEQFAERTLVMVLQRYYAKRRLNTNSKHRQNFQEAMQEVLVENDELFWRLAQ